MNHCCSEYSTARFKLYACEYILTSANTFSLSSQWVLASKRYMLSCLIYTGHSGIYMLASVNTFPASSQWMLASKRYVLSCMILHAFKLDVRVHYSLSIQCILRASLNSRAKRSCKHEHQSINQSMQFIMF